MKRPPENRLLTVVRVLLVACVVITPSVFDLGAVKPFDLVKITTVLFFGWIALGVWVAGVVTGRATARRFLMGYLAGAYLAVATVATLLSPTKVTSFIGWYGRHHGILTVLIYVVIFLLVASVYRQRPDRVHELVYAMGAGAVVITVYVLMQKFHLDPIKWARPSGEVPGQPYFGTMGNANFAGGYIGLTAPWLYLLFSRVKENWQRIAVVVWGVVSLFALYLTSARNGIVALAAALVVLGWIHRSKIPLLIKIGAVAAALAAVLLAVVIIWHPGSDRPPKALRKVDILRSQTIQVRGYWWLAGLEMFKHRPVVGWGPDTFVTVYHRYLSPDASDIGDAETADKPHNVFVEHLAHTGVLGFGAYLALLVVAFRRLFKRIREADRQERVLLTTLAGLLAAYVGQAFFSIDVTAIALIGWVTLGAIAATVDPPEHEAPAPRRKATTAGRVLGAVAIGLACVLAALSTAPLKADHESHTAQRAATRDEFFDDVMAHHERSLGWNPMVPQYRAITAAYLEQQAGGSSDKDERADLYQQSLDLFRQAADLQPGYHLWLVAIGKSEANLAGVGGDASFADAFGHIEDARRLAPADWRIPVALADVYNLRATTQKDPDDLCLALEHYVQGRKMRPKGGEAWTGEGRTFARLGQYDEALVALKKAKRFDKRTNTPQLLIDEIKKIQKSKKRTPRQTCD